MNLCSRGMLFISTLFDSIYEDYRYWGRKSLVNLIFQDRHNHAGSVLLNLNVLFPLRLYFEVLRTQTIQYSVFALVF